MSVNGKWLNVLTRMFAASERGCSTVSGRVVGTRKTDEVVNRVKEELSLNKLMFAVVHINNRQFKVGENDLITLRSNVPLDVGDKIKLEKVLMVGGKNFTLIGRPLLDSSQAIVNATVVEKTTTYPQLKYHTAPGKNIRKIDWMSTEMTVLRINEIIVKEIV